MKKRFSTIGIILGIVIIVLGLHLAFGYHDYSLKGNSTYSYSFGADFYTEIYSATENAADNILAMDNYLRDVMEFLLVAAGLIVAAFGGVVTCYFGCKLADAKNPPVAVPGAPTAVKEETPEEVAAALPEI